MRLKAFAVAVAVLAGPSSVAAQSSVADGVAALARGDYQRAAQILQPNAERDYGAELAAQFFMATMYEQGLGVSQDPLRACALYHRASVFDQQPFGTAAMRLMRAAFLRHGAEFFADCQLLGNLGFDHRFEPVTFELDPGHSIAWTLKGATVLFQGRTSPHEMRLASRGAAYLPLRYTPLPGPSRTRHFVEVFVWYPAGDVWRLNWHLFEVAGSELIRVADEDALTSSPAKPAASARDDARQLVAVRTNVNGQAEWAILEGPGKRSGTIESPEERREARALEETRDAALSKVDWSRKYEVRRLPSLSYGISEGCGNVFVYAWSTDRAEAIAVHVDREALQLTTAPRTIDIARHPDTVTLKVNVYQQPQRSSVSCAHLSVSPGPTEETWRAVAGRLTIELSPPGMRARNPSQYRATIRIDNAEFIDSSGRRHRQAAPIVLSAVVGSGAG